MKKVAMVLTLVFVLSLGLGCFTTVYAACSGKGRSYEVNCYKTFGVYQYCNAKHSASCNNGHSVTLKTRLRMKYTNGSYSKWASGTTGVKLQVPDGKVGKSAHGEFKATCAGNYDFPERSASDKW